MAELAYSLVRSMVERLGGSMVFERKDYTYGAWIITLGNTIKIIKAKGNHSFPELDQFYIPKVKNPKTWDGYANQLKPDAENRLYLLLKLTNLPQNETDLLAEIINVAKWKFAWTYARTYPHEYTRKSMCPPEYHEKLIGLIEQYGVVEPFGEYRNKYLYFQDRKYWHMGDPYSENPDDWPNVINRTWVDVRRHAANVSHVWTEEEVQLQMRIWEIHIEKKQNK